MDIRSPRHRRAATPFTVRRTVVAIIAAALSVATISVVARDDGDDHAAASTGSSGSTGSFAPGPLDGTGGQGSSVTATATATAVGVPRVEAQAFAVYDVTGDRWLAEHRADAPMAVGSVMKLLTAHVVLQAGDLDRVVTVPELTIDDDESVIGLYEGERLPRDVLLRAMLIVSANDAARALALDVGGDMEQFVAEMNAAAAELGLTDTVARNPVGLDADGAHSSARDMVSLAAHLMQDDVFRQAVIKPTARLHDQTFSATNDLLGIYDGATGVKTGHTTEAGYCLIGSATRDGRELIIAVFGAPSDESRLHAATDLLDWGFSVT
jgi:D-alanyl-D-alanine carboxypeptidase